MGELRKKTVLLIRNVKPEFYGGGETYQLMLAEELCKFGFSPVIVSSSRKLLAEAKKRKFGTVKAPYFEEQNYSGVRNLLLPVYFYRMRKLERWYRGIFLKYWPEVVNIQSRDDWIAVTLAAKKMGIRVLWTDHMDFRSWVLTNVSVPLKNIIGKRIVRISRDVYKIVMISDYEKTEVSKMILPRRMPNMVVMKNGAIDRREEFKKIKAQAKSFIYIGRLVSYKGVLELIEAFFSVVKKYPEATLNIYGDGADALECREKAKNCPQIVFHGYTDEPLSAIAENYCFVLPSYREGLSLSLLDAAMMGKVIIASKVGGNPEVVKDGETGLLVPAKDAKELEKKMLKVLEDEELARGMAKNAREKYERELDFEKTFAEKMLPLYNIEKE